MTSRGIDGNDRSIVYRCDNLACGEYLVTDTDDELPEPWRFVRVPLVVGAYHACSDICERKLRRMLGA